jgi:hypothetical protein
MCGRSRLSSIRHLSLTNRNFEPRIWTTPPNFLSQRGNSNGYRMGQVNSRRESRASERDFEPPAPARGEQPSAKNGRIPGLLSGYRCAERLSPEGVLAEGEELSSNPLCVRFQRLRITHILMDRWRMIDSPKVRRVGRPAKRPSIRTSSRAAIPTSWCAATPPPEIRPVLSSTAGAVPGRSPRSISKGLADA